jgi:pre-mRNA-splicing factor CDC5/CEF1
LHEEALREGLRLGLSGLPAPKNEYQVMVPTEEADDEPMEDVPEEDAADIAERKRAEAKAREEAELKKRSQVGGLGILLDRSNRICTEAGEGVVISMC